MKKILFVLPILLGLCAISSIAQDRGPDEDSPRVQELRKEYFNQELQFSEAETAAFWPIYERYKKELKSAKESGRKPKMELLTDAEAEQYLDDHFVKEEKLLTIRKQFVADLRGKIGVRKIALINHTERKFKRELFQKVRENRRGNGGGRRF